jgi:hypothetical protein
MEVNETCPERDEMSERDRHGEVQAAAVRNYRLAVTLARSMRERESICPASRADNARSHPRRTLPKRNGAAIGPSIQDEQTQRKAACGGHCVCQSLLRKRWRAGSPRAGMEARRRKPDHIGIGGDGRLQQ